MVRPFAIALALLSAGCAPAEPPPECGSEGFACFRGIFFDLVGNAVEGLELCAPDEDVDCATTDGTGGFQLPGLPRDADVVVTAEHPDFVPTVFSQNTAWDWYAWNKAAVPSWVLDSHAERLDVELDPARGHLVFLLWLFIGVGLASDTFMNSIEEITSTKKSITLKDGSTKEVDVWNPTVANLSLMALGSSAPEILLSCIELFTSSPLC